MDTNALYEFVGSRIRKRREALRISQEKLGARLSLSRTSVVNIEAGRQKAPLHVLWNVAKALDTELTAFIPSNSELTTNSGPIKLDERTIQQIEEAAGADAATRRNLTAFISRVKRKSPSEN